jgi:hypothetical protein
MTPEPRDYALVREAIRAWRNGDNPLAADGIRFDCFNEDEARMLREIAAQWCPEMPVHTRWFTFGTRGR